MADDDKLRLPRRALVGGLASLSGLALAGCADDGPATYGDILRIADNFTWRAQRLLMPRHRLATQYSHDEITSIPAIGTTDPADPHQPAYDGRQGALYDRLRAGGFADWTLAVEGAVARPGRYSLADLKRFPARTQVTRHSCEEGWSAIAEWTGAPLAAVLAHAGVLPQARYVNFECFDAQADSIDMWDATHPQTLLAYGMNGRDLPQGHGAPVRLRVETQIGYKNFKFLRRIVVSDRFIDPGRLGPLRNGWSWYVGI